MYNPEKAKENVKALLTRIEQEYGRKYSVTTEETGSGFGWKIKAYGNTVAWITLRPKYLCKGSQQTRDIDVEFPQSSRYSHRYKRYAFRSDSPRLYERLCEAVEDEHDREKARKAASEQKSFNHRVFLRMLELMPEGAPFEIYEERMTLKRGSETVGQFKVSYSSDLVFNINRQGYRVDYASNLFAYLSEWVECARLAFDIAIHELRPQ